MNRRAQAGFTMVEMLIALSVTTIVVVVIMSFMMKNIQTSTQETTQATILREVQQTLDFVNSDIRISANADLNNRNADANSPGGVSNPFGWTSNSNTLVLATAATTTNGTIIFTDPANYVTTKDNIVYFVSAGTLYKRTLASSVSGNGTKTTCPAGKVTTACPADKALLHNVKAFTLTYRDGSDNAVAPTDARSVEVALTASFSQYRKTQTASYTTRMVFRND